MLVSSTACKTIFQLFEKYKQVWGPAFGEIEFLDKEGHTIKGSQLEGARDGCSIFRTLGWDEISCRCPSHQQILLVLNEKDKEPLAGIHYQVRKKSGEIIYGVTDDFGYTQKIETCGEEPIEIEIYQINNENKIYKGTNYE